MPRNAGDKTEGARMMRIHITRQRTCRYFPSEPDSYHGRGLWMVNDAGQWVEMGDVREHQLASIRLKFDRMADVELVKHSTFIEEKYGT
jgi:hypothetical protein